LTILLVSVFASISSFQANAQVNTNTTSNLGNLNSYDWPEYQGDSSFTRFSAGPAPDTSNVLWKANITSIQPYLTAFDGLIFVCTNTSVVALDQNGNIVWDTAIPINGTWPIAYEIDDSHMIVEGTCLDPTTGQILWTSSQFNEDAGLFSANVYSSEQQMFYIKAGSYIEAWSFANPAVPPTLAWTAYVPGGGTTGTGTTYGQGLVFPGSFMNQQIALNATTGAIVWDTPTKGPMIFDGAYSDGMFFRGGTDDNTMYCFNATNGQILWTYTPTGDTDGYFVTGPAVAYGMVYEMNKDGYLYAFNMQTGNLVWKYKGPDNTLLWPGMPSVADGMVYVTTSEVAEYGGQMGTSQYACLNAYTGQVVWTLPIEALAPRESAIIAYGNLYIIPGTVTTSVDSFTGDEYNRINQVWCIGTNSTTVSDWSMFRADPTHSSTAQVGLSSLNLAWKFATNGSVISSPSVVKGIVYFGSQDHNIYAVGAWSGNLIWEYATGGSIESSPAVANGNVYIESDDGYIYCLNANTGSLVWRTFIDSNLTFTYASIVLKSSPVVVGNTVYIGSLNGNLYALDANTGNIIWTFQTNGPVESSPAFSDGAIYFTSQELTEAAIYALDANTGALIWKQQFPYVYSPIEGGNEMLGSPSVAAGLVFTSTDLRTFYTLNATTGDIVWICSDPAASEFIISSPIYVNGDVYILDNFNITCFNAMTGSTIWTIFTGDELYVAPSYAGGNIYLVTSEDHIYVLDTALDGTRIAAYTTPSSSWSSPTIANGMLYVGCNDWNLYCFSSTPTSASTPTPSPPPTQNITLEQTITTIIAGVIAVMALATIITVRQVIRKQIKK
jgi:outer membrane protein assembly factor BamB